MSSSLHSNNNDTKSTPNRRNVLSSSSKATTTTTLTCDIQQPIQVTIYAEADSWESYDIFRQQNYTVILDGSYKDVWLALSTADIAILSRSSFSYVPAIFN